MKCAIEGNLDLLVALSTGSGKSIIPMVAATVTKKTFVIVVPLISLLEDWERRLRKAGMRYTVFKATSPPFYDCPIVLTTTDTAVGEEFSDAIGRSYADRNLGALVLDEVHEILASKTFRPCMQKMWGVRKLIYPIIGMSGTIPVNMEQRLLSELCLKPNTPVVRQSSNRPELTYIIESPLTELAGLTTRIQNISQDHLMEPSDRALVFVTTIMNGELLAGSLGCEFYCADTSVYVSKGNQRLMDEGTRHRIAAERRKGIIENWQTGRYWIMVATTAFGAGNDYPGVRVVILANTPFDMASVVQQFGRAGRDGNQASCYIIPSKRLLSRPGQQSVDFCGHSAATEMIWDSTKCVRFLLTKYVDGKEATCCLEDSKNMACSRCQSRIHGEMKSLAPARGKPSGIILVPPSSSIVDVVSSVSL